MRERQKGREKDREQKIWGCVNYIGKGRVEEGGGGGGGGGEKTVKYEDKLLNYSSHNSVLS